MKPLQSQSSPLSQVLSPGVLQYQVCLRHLVLSLQSSEANFAQEEMKNRALFCWHAFLPFREAYGKTRTPSGHVPGQNLWHVQAIWAQPWSCGRLAPDHSLLCGAVLGIIRGLLVLWPLLSSSTLPRCHKSLSPRHCQCPMGYIVITHQEQLSCVLQATLVYW